MKIGILVTIILVLISCKNVTEKESEKLQIVVDSTGLKIKKAEKESPNSNLTSFLENPINLKEFKNKKNTDVTTGVTNGFKYYFHPEKKDSIFYGYNFFTNKIGEIGINKIVVFKYGKNKHKYADETEILIELKVFHKDSDLGKANLIGLFKTELESEFGVDYLTFDNGIVYSNKNRVLIVELVNKKVKSYRFIKLNTENIDNELVQQIVK